MYPFRTTRTPSPIAWKVDGLRWIAAIFLRLANRLERLEAGR